MEYVTLNNGVKMPKLGYGVFQTPPEDTRRCVLEAIETGYRSIDTSQAYGTRKALEMRWQNAACRGRNCLSPQKSGFQTPALRRQRLLSKRLLKNCGLIMWICC